jgi:hypothetical protein
VEPFEHDVDGLPPRGCNHVRCTVCGALVRAIDGVSARDGFRRTECAALFAAETPGDSPLLRSTKDVRLYLCRCAFAEQSHREGALDDPDTDRMVGDPIVPWRCAGHPLLTLPHVLDGIAVNGEDLPALTDRALGGFFSPDAHPADRSPVVWLARLYARLTGSAWASLVDHAVARGLTDDDPTVRMRALKVVARVAPPAALAAARRLLCEHPAWFEGVEPWLARDLAAGRTPPRLSPASLTSAPPPGVDRRAFTVPATELARLRSSEKFGYGPLDELDLHDGAFSALVCVGEFTRDGKTFALFQSSPGWAIEVELTRRTWGSLRALTPEEAWQLRQAREAKQREEAELLAWKKAEGEGVSHLLTK